MMVMDYVSCMVPPEQTRVKQHLFSALFCRLTAFLEASGETKWVHWC